MSEMSSPALVLIVVDAAYDPASDLWSIDERSTLARVASLGHISPIAHARARDAAALKLWQVGALDALGLTAQRAQLPSAALSQLGESGRIPPATEYWAHLECVHFAPGMSDVAAAALAGAAALTEQDRAELAATLGPHLASSGYELVTGRAEWRVRCPRALEVQTLPPALAFEAPLKEALPSGADAAELRRLMTEMQMLLHEHPVNARRARGGLPAANATWMWSVASLAREISSSPLPAAFGDEPYLKGLYLLHSQTMQAESFDVSVLRESAQASPMTIALVKPDAVAALEADWLLPLFDALRSGVFAQLIVYFDRWRFALRRRELLRFWRRPLPPSRWPL